LSRPGQLGTCLSVTAGSSSAKMSRSRGRSWGFKEPERLSSSEEEDDDDVLEVDVDAVLEEELMLVSISSECIRISRRAKPCPFV